MFVHCWLLKQSSSFWPCREESNGSRTASLQMFWDKGYTVVVLANYDGAAGMVARRIASLLTQQ